MAAKQGQEDAGPNEGEDTKLIDANDSKANEGTPPNQPTRRSSRVTAKSTRLFTEPFPKRCVVKRTPNSARTMTEARRNPKRKASEPAKNLSRLPTDLLEEALKPLDPKEIEQWEGWVELESEPAFFSIILRDLGVENVKAQELFAIDQSSIDVLPKPVFGLIFLFQYVPGLDDTQDEDEAGDVWFANQTIHNACATVALMNIAMNAPGIKLGDQLKQFKESTKNLSTPLRGYRLASDTFIRSIHNSFTRRMDHLNADLALENEASEPKPKKCKSRTTQKKGKAPNRKTTANADYGFHFIAYVPVDGQVWELDGLRTKPRKLGPVDSEDWTTVARPQIEARMLQYEDSQLSFNLLALCQSPLALHSRDIASGLASLRYLYESISKLPQFGYFEPPDAFLDEASSASFLSEFQLSPLEIERAEIPQKQRHQAQQIDAIQDAKALHKQLVVDIKATMGEYRAELVAMAEDEQRVKGRRKDYGPALHKWVSKLADKGVLEDMIKNT